MFEVCWIVLVRLAKSPLGSGSQYVKRSGANMYITRPFGYRMTGDYPEAGVFVLANYRIRQPQARGGWQKLGVILNERSMYVMHFCC